MEINLTDSQKEKIIILFINHIKNGGVFNDKKNILTKEFISITDKYIFKITLSYANEHKKIYRFDLDNKTNNKNFSVIYNDVTYMKKEMNFINNFVYNNLYIIDSDIITYNDDEFDSIVGLTNLLDYRTRKINNIVKNIKKKKKYNFFNIKNFFKKITIYSIN